MNKFFRNNQKKLLAVFGVVLMIAFIVPTTFQGFGDNTQYTAGYIGQTAVYRQQLDLAADEWIQLSRRLVVRSQQPGQQQWMPIPPAMLGMDAAQAIQEQPELYYLLQHEAQQMGLVPQYREADEWLNEPIIGVSMPDGSVIPYADLPDSPLKNELRQNFARLLMVNGAFRRAVEAVKISEPLLDHEVAARLQNAKSYIVSFNTSDYESQVGQPTPEQLQEQFNKFADIEQGTPASDVNPFGFGYKYPNRIKLDYVAIPREEIRKAVRASKDEYAWEVEANRYYLQHQKEFPSTQPAATQEAFSLTTTQPSPTTRPFAEVREDILTRLIDPLVERQANHIQAEIIARLNADYEKWQQAQATTTPSTNPTTAPGTYASFEYLQKLSQDIQNKYRVTLRVASVADQFRSESELAKLEGIGQVPSFAEYATVAAAPFVPETARQDPNVLQLYKPSRPMSDTSQTSYIFRVTAAEPAHRPASLDEVRDLVAADWKRQRAFELAKADAEKLAEAARSSNLKDAAGSRTVITTDRYSMMNPVIPELPLSSDGQQKLVQKTFEIASVLAKPEPGKPIGVIELPPDNKVAVVEVIFLESGEPEFRQMAESFISRQIADEYRTTIAQQWFDYNAVVQRTGFRTDRDQVAISDQ